jgi:hypothetical protein
MLEKEAQMEDKIEVGEYVRVNNDNRNCIGIGKAIRLVNESVYMNMNNKYKDGKSIIALIGIIGEKDIQTILTKEQFEANCYKVGGEE